LKGREGRTHREILFGTSSSVGTQAHNSSYSSINLNTQSSFPAESRVDHVPLYDTVMVMINFLLTALALVLRHTPDSDALPGRFRLGGVAGDHKLS
jgi:hypothetical protein